MTQVSRIMGISKYKCYRAMNSYLRPDPKKSKFLKIMTRRSYKQNLINVDKRRKLTPNMVSFIINPDTVKKWAGLSLDARAVMFHR